MSATRWADMTPEAREKARIRQKRYEASDKGRAKYARYRATEKYAAVQDRFQATGRRNITSAANRRKLQEERPDVAAWMRVWTALRQGLLVRPNTCQSCSRGVRLDAHHHRGYAEEHALDVVWLCRRCHKAAHREGVV